MRWPVDWRDVQLLDLIKGSAVNCLVMESAEELRPISEQARREGFRIAPIDSLPEGVNLIGGSWPGVKLNEAGATDWVSAGPTGNPWIDSNGWQVRLEGALHPEKEIWVDAPPKAARITADSCIVAIADASVFGGRWLITLDGKQAAALAARSAAALSDWRRILDAAAFFAARPEWPGYAPAAVVGIVSDFTGGNRFLSHELLNLLARANQQYRIIPKGRASAESPAGLKALIYLDDQPPDDALRGLVLAFVKNGGMLITSRVWGEAALPADPGGDHPRYRIGLYGKGRIAVCKGEPDDPFLIANDSVVLVSHRHEMVRLWNGGAVGACLSHNPDRKRALLQLIFYSSAPSQLTTIRVAGEYKSASLWLPGRQEKQKIDSVAQRGAIELHLPAIPHYGAVELE
jgi:hypothetical protein